MRKAFLNANKPIVFFAFAAVAFSKLFAVMVVINVLVVLKPCKPLYRIWVIQIPAVPVIKIIIWNFECWYYIFTYELKHRISAISYKPIVKLTIYILDVSIWHRFACAKLRLIEINRIIVHLMTRTTIMKQIVILHEKVEHTHHTFK